MLGVWRALITLHLFYSQQLDDCAVPNSLTRKAKHQSLITYSRITKRAVSSCPLGIGVTLRFNQQQLVVNTYTTHIPRCKACDILVVRSWFYQDAASQSSTVLQEAGDVRWSKSVGSF
jgi:hypothetical protein